MVVLILLFGEYVSIKGGNIDFLIGVIYVYMYNIYYTEDRKGRCTYTFKTYVEEKSL